MNFLKIATDIEDVLSKDGGVFFYTEPVIEDFTQKFVGNICFETLEKTLRIPIEATRINTLVAILNETISKAKSFIITWDIKRLCSYFKFFAQKVSLYVSKVFDLKYIELFNGVSKQIPKSFKEAYSRLKQNYNKKTLSIHHKIHLPLAFEVLPDIETTGLLNHKANYSSYEIEGQSNGRLLCRKTFSNCFNPHNWSMDERKQYAPRDVDSVFIVLDYKYMEPVMFQWLSKDERLLELLEYGKDLYGSIYEIVMKDKCDSPKKRTFMKEVFLPVVYGQQSFSLSKKHGISVEKAQIIIKRIDTEFSTAMKWIQDKQDDVTDHATDFFGRTKNIDSPYKARNFLIQASASIVCLEKLIVLHRELEEKGKIAFFIHDGYGIVCSKKDYRKVALLSKNVLESNSMLCPGLSFKTRLEVGTKLDKLQRIGQ